MPLFELFGDSSRRKLDSNQEKLTDLSFIPESDFAELIWENGQVMVQGGQSSRGTKIHSLHGLPSYYNSPSQSPKHSRDRGNAVLEANNNGDGNENGVSSSSGRFRTFESGLNEFSAEMCDDDGDDDIVPWFNSPINDSLPELSGITENTFDWMKKNKETNLHTSANDGVSQVHFASFGAKGEATASATSTSNASCENTSQFPNSDNFVNFSYFSRPKSLNRSIGWNNSVIPNSDASSMERAAFSGKQEGPSAAVKQTNGSKSMESNRTEQPSCSKNCERIHPDDAPKIIGIRDKNGCGSTSRDTLDAVELVVASSVCSGNGLDGVLDYLACNLKKKSRDTYDSETPSDDIEEDSIGLRKAGTARGNSSKRGRAAEVHNLSERRRRDRINEKMRALQELIPNCNKVDKASMLDEAIEYLKTLQIQVQIMSMGAGLYMPPMMFSAGMNPAQIQAMGVGMASGFGSGIGSSGFPLMQIPPPMHFPSPYMSCHPAMHGALLPNYPFIGVPGLMSMQQWSPMVPFPVDPVPVHQPGSGTQSNGSVSGTTECLKKPIVNADAAVRCSTNPPPSQGQQSLNGGGFKQSPCVQYIMNPIPDSSS